MHSESIDFQQAAFLQDKMMGVSLPTITAVGLISSVAVCGDLSYCSLVKTGSAVHDKVPQLFWMSPNTPCFEAVSLLLLYSALISFDG